MRCHSAAATIRGTRSNGKIRSAAGVVAVDVEGDAHVQQRAFGRLLAAQQLAVGQRVDELAERARRRPRLAVGVEHLVEETARFVVGEPHGNRACGH